jgi:hypothetical protein
VVITRPIMMTLEEWADRVVYDLDAFGAVRALNNAEEWQDWAAQFLNNAKIGRALPNPYEFDNWTDWAERLCGVLS